MTTIKPSDEYAILINTSKVTPNKAEELIDILHESSNTMRHIEGFVSANLHLSEDQTRVVNYVQWKSKADFQAMLQNAEAQPHMRAAANVAESYDPVIYSLRYSDK